ncbi:Precorrin-2 dehydrogenase [bacterium HR12]|nr:Precorrin-2 dehydrogenase [bacterium HR12]
MGRFGYPVLLDLSGRLAVVVGERAVADGKVEGLLEGGAAGVLVLAEGPEARLARLAADERVWVERRPWRPEDLEGAAIVIGSPGPDAAELARAARAAGALVNVVDDVPNCDVAAPAVVRRGELLLTVSTGGRSPTLARLLREDLERRFGPEWALVVEVLGEVRERSLGLLPDLGERAARWLAALDLEEARELAAAGRGDELRARLLARLVGTAQGVGAGVGEEVVEEVRA